MAVSKFIQSVKDEARGRPRSTQWYKDKIKEFGKPGTLDLIRDGKRSNKPFYGKLNMFVYDPKHKKKLPYYDTFPWYFHWKHILMDSLASICIIYPSLLE